MKLKNCILYEDNHLIILNKPAGILVQGDNTGDVPLSEEVKSYLKKEYHKPGKVFVGVIHRLDRPTSGCIVYARTSKALSRMTQIFAKRELTKTYWALASSSSLSSGGTLINYIEKKEQANKVICHTSPHGKAKRAELDYQELAKFGSTSLYEIQLKTGRKHQIRAQFGLKGAKIVGDLKYGYPLPNNDKSICLHSKSIAFVHPVSLKSIKIEASLPQSDEWLHVNNWLKKKSNFCGGITLF
ncbi:MAG: RluA family pseudouridine synthase [Saprospiraceae bacterium]